MATAVHDALLVGGPTGDRAAIGPATAEALERLGLGVSCARCTRQHRALAHPGPQRRGFRSFGRSSRSCSPGRRTVTGPGGGCGVESIGVRPHGVAARRPGSLPDQRAPPGCVGLGASSGAARALRCWPPGCGRGLRRSRSTWPRCPSGAIGWSSTRRSFLLCPHRRLSYRPYPQSEEYRAHGRHREPR